MRKIIRTAVYDKELKIEAYRLEGYVRPFPSHFHEYYVIGYVEAGQRVLICKDRKYDIGPEHILLLNPGDNHTCVQSDGKALDYRGFNISPNILLRLAERIGFGYSLPAFTPSAATDNEAACCLRTLHQLVMSGSKSSDKEDHCLAVIKHLLHNYGKPLPRQILRYSDEIEQVCTFIEQNYSERICLNQLCRCASLSRSTLLRAFTRVKGITPYRYLENIRISHGKNLLEQGVSPIEAALRTGFSDQSHFTNCFNRFIGLSPGAYQNIFKKEKEGN